MRVLADLRGEGDPENEEARDEFRAIKEGVLIERAAGKRTYLKMWKLYKYRVLIAFSSQLFAQLNGIKCVLLIGLDTVPTGLTRSFTAVGQTTLEI